MKRKLTLILVACTLAFAGIAGCHHHRHDHGHGAHGCMKCPHQGDCKAMRDAAKQ